MAELIRSDARHIPLADESVQCVVTSPPLRTCSQPGCERPLIAKGYCTMHYSRWRAGRNMAAPIGSLYGMPTQARLAYWNRPKKQPDACLIPGCSRPQISKGLCNTHYSRQRMQARRALPVEHECSYVGCAKANYARELCDGHYKQLRRGVALRPLGRDYIPRLPLNTKRTVKNGYVRVKIGEGPRGPHDGWMLEHRYVMEEELGRPLLKHETVHHVNGDRADNRIENLELFSSSHPSGQRVIDKIRWAEDLLKLYKPQRHLFEDLPLG